MNARTHEVRRVQGIICGPAHRAIHDLSYETGRSVGELVGDGVLLLLRYHDRGHGLPEPTPPVPSTSDEKEAR
jgi:hypothetical protein